MIVFYTITASYKSWVIAFFCTLFFITASAQQSDSLQPSQKIFSAAFDYGNAIVHTKQVESIRGANPHGFELQYSHLNTSKKLWDKWGFFPQTGWTIAYFDYNRALLGHSYSVSYYVQPVYRLSNYFSVSIKGSVGLAYLSNPFDSVKNPTNQNYSTRINSFLRVGAGVNYNVGKNWQLNAMALFNHHSNGGYQQPNRGLNYITLALGVSHFTQHTQLPKYTRTKDNSWKKNKHQWLDAGIYFSPKQGYNSAFKSERKLLLGGMVQVSKQVGRVNAITGAVELYYDGAVKSIKQNIGDHSSNLYSGILIGHEFLIDRFIFSQQLGVYVFKQTKYYQDNYLYYHFQPIYERWGLRYRFSQHWFAGFNLLAHGHIADYIDLRAIYRF